MEKHITIILKEMCNRVGQDFHDVNFKSKDWFQKNTWSEKEQENFSKWLEDYLYNNKEAREELMALSHKNRKSIRIVVGWFMLNYGWKIKWEE